MEFTYETQGANTYLVYEIKNNEVIDSMSLGMLTNNKINCLIPTYFTQVNEDKYIKYNISSTVSLRRFFDGLVNKKRLIGVFEGIITGLLSAEDYMLDINSIILDMDYIFVDVSTCEASVICLPVNIGESKQIDLVMFFKNILLNTQFDKTEDGDYVVEIINFLNASPVLSLNDFKELLQEIRLEPNKVVKNEQPKIISIENSANHVFVTTNEKSENNETVKNNAINSERKENSEKVIPNEQVYKQSVNNKGVSTSTVQNSKKMSMFYLLMHYSKENIELYKAQRGNKKVDVDITKKDLESLEQSQRKSLGFAIPGQEVVNTQTQNKNTNESSVNQHNKQVVESVNEGSSNNKSEHFPKEKTANFGETTSLKNMNKKDTTLLSESQKPTHMVAPHLIRKDNNEKISLNKPNFTLGREGSFANYAVGKDQVSKSHAVIITRDTNYYILDTNSLNHTYVNGEMIPANVEIAITHGDKILLADVEFEFRLY